MLMQDITTITAEQAAFVLPYLATVGFKPNEAGEIVTENATGFKKLQFEIVFALAEHERTRPQRRIVVVEGFKPKAPKLSPLDALARFGCPGEGLPFPVAGDHSLSLVRAAVRDLGGNWRLWASVEDDGGEGIAPRFRCIVGRADAWPYPSTVEVAGESKGKGPQAGDFAGTSFAAARVATGLPYRATATATAARGPDLYDSEAQRLASTTSVDLPAVLHEASTDFPPKLSAALGEAIGSACALARAEGCDLAFVTTRRLPDDNA